MFKYLALYFSVIVICVCAPRKEQEHFTVIVEGLRRKAADDDFDEISLTKHLFQDIFTDHQKDDKLQFGYVCENPIQWEQRFEEKDLLNNRHRGKVKWGDVDGGYGEQYWDLNH